MGTPVCSSMKAQHCSISFMVFFMTSSLSNCIVMGSANSGLSKNQSCRIVEPTEPSHASLTVKNSGL